ncbi:MAG: hypothetical protein EXQ86_09030 [Rhodospirillales bacterium]|nr:hypothetical protein [Rhodospirillales bacterium]
MMGAVLPLVVSVAVSLAAWSLGRAYGAAEAAAETKALMAAEPVPVAITNVYEFAAACVAAVEAWGVAPPASKTRPKK